MSYNPLAIVESDVFGRCGGGITNVDIDISFPTAGRLRFPVKVVSFSFTPISVRPGSTLVIRAVGSGANASVITAFGQYLDPPSRDCTASSVVTTSCTGGCGPTCNLTLDFSGNNFSAVSVAALINASVTKLVLSRNNLTQIATDGALGIERNTRLRQLDLSHNLLTVIPMDLVDSLAALETLVIDNNRLLVLPQRTIGIALADAVHNTVRCGVYSPVAAECTCTPPLHASLHCGYVRCTPTADGCPPGSIFNSSNCAAAPQSQCITGAVRGMYYSAVAGVFLPVTDCTTAYPGLPAYQVTRSTATSNRHCSICATCPTGYTVSSPCTPTSDTACTLHCASSPFDGATAFTFREQSSPSALDGVCAPCSTCASGFDVTPCTPTSNTKCVRPGHLSTGAVAAIVLSVVILAVGATGCAIYGRAQYRRRVAAGSDLDEAEMQLLTARQESAESQATVQRILAAWEILPQHLTFLQRLAEGTYGEVWKGLWGSQTIAIKVLKQGGDTEFGAEDFRKECEILQAIKHPNLIVFLGAGTTAEGKSFMVTEYLAGGSLRTTLRNQLVTLDGWCECGSQSRSPRGCVTSTRCCLCTGTSSRTTCYSTTVSTPRSLISARRDCSCPSRTDPRSQPPRRRPRSQ
eukprot:m.294691 g.294691  ORF g.294691 m.294691 type:complete len:635 (+) comp27166_c2_seq17:1399-3303(+)